MRRRISHQLHDSSTEKPKTVLDVPIRFSHTRRDFLLVRLRDPMQQALSSRLLDPKRYSAMPAPRQNSVEKKTPNNLENHTLNAELRWGAGLDLELE